LSPNPDEGSKVPPKGNKQEKSDAQKLDDLFADDKKETLKGLAEQHETKKKDKTDDDGEKDGDEDYIVIDGKRFREIQIEGEADEFLMDDDGNIYDKEGVYIGTAKDGGDEEEEEENDK
jgi:hypothetical protein